MKKISIAAAFLFALNAGSAVGASMTALERQRLVAHLEMTGSWLAGEVSGLSPAQLRFRPAPGAWSVIEVVEHLVVAEPIYWQDLRKAMQAPPSSRKRTGTDAEVLWYGIDRTQPQKAVAAEESKGQLRDLGAGLDGFGKLRARMLDYARTTNDDLRGHVVEREQSDAYQWLLLISTHAQRHILQIREIKADPRFPTK
ncbi:MAG: DinB family protein [Bryobacterales bacterium]|nr:DinB family protein [Bryobacterales bacterium]